LNFRDILLQNTHVSNFVKIRPMGAELFHADRQRASHLDRQTDRGPVTKIDRLTEGQSLR